MVSIARLSFRNLDLVLIPCRYYSEENSRREKAIEMAFSFETLKELKNQNALLEKEYKESQIALVKSKKYNLIMLIIAIISAVAAVVSMIVAILK